MGQMQDMMSSWANQNTKRLLIERMHRREHIATLLLTLDSSSSTELEEELPTTSYY